MLVGMYIVVWILFGFGILMCIVFGFFFIGEFSYFKECVYFICFFNVVFYFG